MGLFDRISRVIRSNINDLVSKAENPEKILEQAIVDMGEDLVQLRQSVASMIAQQKKTQQQYNHSQSEVNSWTNRAQLALQKGDENLAREALTRKKSHQETANALKITLDQQIAQVEQLKRNLMALESKISEAKTKKDMLKARLSAAKANEQLQSSIGSLNTSGSMAAFERMEQKVIEAEARTQAVYELGGADLEAQFRALESDGVDEELAQMKAQLAGGSVNQASLPQSKPNSATNSEVDAELEELKKRIDNL